MLSILLGLILYDPHPSVIMHTLAAVVLAALASSVSSALALRRKRAVAYVDPTAGGGSMLDDGEFPGSALWSYPYNLPLKPAVDWESPSMYT